MSALSGVVNKLVSFWTRNATCVLKYLPWFFFGVSLSGSLLKELDVVPETYFSSSRNVLNLYFVKVSWGWNLFLLLPFVFLSNSYNRSSTYVLKRLLALVVATIFWYVCTETFFYIEDVTGACYESNSTQLVNKDFNTKAECRKAGLLWDGFDISGHSFILAYSCLIIMEEIVPMMHIVRHGFKKTAFLDVLYIALNAAVVLWVWMFFCTSVYFHDPLHKILGTLFAVLSWYVTYKFWYLKPYSPGLPPRHCDKRRY